MTAVVPFRAKKPKVSAKTRRRMRLTDIIGRIGREIHLRIRSNQHAGLIELTSQVYRIEDPSMAQMQDVLDVLKPAILEAHREGTAGCIGVSAGYQQIRSKGPITADDVKRILPFGTGKRIEGVYYATTRPDIILDAFFERQKEMGYGNLRAAHERSHANQLTAGSEEGESVPIEVRR